MSWTNRLKQFSGLGGTPERGTTTAFLLDLSAAAAALKRAADLAPTPMAQDDLRPVITRAETIVHQVRELLHDYGAMPTKAPATPSNIDAHNHWARLFDALEQHRSVRQRLRELSISVEDTDPALSEALAGVGREEDQVVENLRDLIALADPQASN